jgi:Ankyrin repeats (3 copies)
MRPHMFIRDVVVSSHLAATLAVAGCGGSQVTAIGGGWYVDQAAAGKPPARLYYEHEGKRLVVDRLIEAYRLYAQRCLIYEAPRANGRFLFVTWGRLTPIAFRSSVGTNRWRLDTDGPRRFDTPIDPDGRRLLSIEWINFGNACYVAQLQPPLHDRWQDAGPFDADHVKSEESVVDVDGEDSVGNSTLSDAAREGQVVLVDELLRAGADVNSANHSGVSVLMSAVGGRHEDVVRRLIKGGARVDAQDGRGMTALMYAARYRNLDMAKLLLQSGAKPTIRDDMGRTAAVFVPESGTNTDPLRTLLEGAVGTGR